MTLDDTHDELRVPLLTLSFEMNYAIPEQEAHVARSYFMDLYRFTEASLPGVHFPSQLIHIKESQDSSGFVEAKYFVELMALGVKQSGNAYWGLEFGRQVTAQTFSLLAYLALSSEDLMQAAQLLCEYEGLASDLGSAQLLITKDKVGIEWQENEVLLGIVESRKDLHESRFVVSHIVDAVLAGWIQFSRQMVGDALSPCDIHLKRNESLNTDHYRSVWQCDVQLAQPRNVIWVTPETMALPVKSADKKVNALLKEQANELLINSHFYWTARTIEAIQATLGYEWVSVESVSQRLNVSVRQLQRYLQKEKQSFKSLWDARRRYWAKLWLMDPNKSLTDIADQLQFSDQSAFSRAFKRWEGQPPLQYRQRHQL